MLADEAIEKAFVTLAAVAMAVTRLLVQDFFHMGCEGIGILNYRIREIFRAHGRRKRAGRSFIVESGNVGGVLRLGEWG